MNLRFYLLAGWVMAGFAAAVRAESPAFDFEVLRYRAKVLANQPYAPRATRVPEWLLKLSYDEHRDIRFRPEQAWWRREGLPFQLQFFHPGFLASQTVQISEVNEGRESPIGFDAKFFSYGAGRIKGDIPESMGFSGLRLHYALNGPAYMDELAVFQGASYFRALGAGQRYGLSARGLALGTAEMGGEEFPVFESFWIERPAAGAKEITVYALLDSPSVAGAYRFQIAPGADTTMKVKMTLFFRSTAKTVGIAPLTSMFWHGENTNTAHGDFRPEVHDSDGLLLNTGAGEWLWRPLTNPNAVRVSAFGDENPRGFGLMQRDRNFENYQDLEAAYHLRPSAWVEPIGRWGRGAVRLVELSTPDETNDNIVAFWVPETLPAKGEPLTLEYKLHWVLDQIRPPSGYTVATRHGHSKTHEPDLERFIVDFAGPYLDKQGPDPDIFPMITVGDGARLVHSDVQKNPYNGTWRVAFALRADGSKRPVELRGYLKKAPHVLTETWSYLWQP